MEFRRVEDSAAPAPMAPGLSDVEAMSTLASQLREQAAAAEAPATVGLDHLVRPYPPAPAGPVVVKIPSEVRLARYLWSAEYHASGLGMVDWWMRLDPARKDFAAAALRSIID